MKNPNLRCLPQFPRRNRPRRSNWKIRSMKGCGSSCCGYGSCGGLCCFVSEKWVQFFIKLFFASKREVSMLTNHWPLEKYIGLSHARTFNRISDFHSRNQLITPRSFCIDVIDANIDDNENIDLGI